MYSAVYISIPCLWWLQVFVVVCVSVCVSREVPQRVAWFDSRQTAAEREKNSGSLLKKNRAFFLFTSILLGVAFSFMLFQLLMYAHLVFCYRSGWFLAIVNVSKVLVYLYICTLNRFCGSFSCLSVLLFYMSFALLLFFRSSLLSFCFYFSPYSDKGKTVFSVNLSYPLFSITGPFFDVFVFWRFPPVFPFCFCFLFFVCFFNAPTASLTLWLVLHSQSLLWCLHLWKG